MSWNMLEMYWKIGKWTTDQTTGSSGSSGFSLGKMVCSKTGALMGVGVHGVAIIRALCGDEPVVVSATVSRHEMQ